MLFSKERTATHDTSSVPWLVEWFDGFYCKNFQNSLDISWKLPVLKALAQPIKQPIPDPCPPTNFDGGQWEVCVQTYFTGANDHLPPHSGSLS